MLMEVTALDFLLHFYMSSYIDAIPLNPTGIFLLLQKLIISTDCSPFPPKKTKTTQHPHNGLSAAFLTKAFNTFNHFLSMMKDKKW